MGGLLAAGVTFYILHLSYGKDWRLAYTAAGAFLAWAFFKTGKLRVAVALHFLGNLLMGANDLSTLLGVPGFSP